MHTDLLGTEAAQPVRLGRVGPAGILWADAASQTTGQDARWPTGWKPVLLRRGVKERRIRCLNSVDAEIDAGIEL